MTETTIITTQIRSDSDDFDIRREFCGFQDERLNDLRQFTSCIIDLQIHSTKNPFEKVTWIISHYDEVVRAFVVKRLQAWAKTTEIAAQMHTEDVAFHQQNLSDVSSCSTDVKGQQLGSSAKTSPSPPRSSVPRMFNKHSKTPLHDHHFGSIPNAALVPQTDLQQRHQQRRRRNSSSSSSGICRPALFGKPSGSFLSRTNGYPRSRYSPSATPNTKYRPNNNEFAFVKPFNPQLQKEDSFELSKIPQKEIISDINDKDNVDLEEEARWENLLSDTSDYESNCHPLMADIILLSQLRDCLINSHLSSDDNDIGYIQSILTPHLSITQTEQCKILYNKSYYFCRLILNSKIILSNGVHQSSVKAQELAYKKMIELITNKQGVEIKIISNGRCKVVLRKSLPPKQFNETTIIDSSMNIPTNA